MSVIIKQAVFDGLILECTPTLETEGAILIKQGAGRTANIEHRHHSVTNHLYNFISKNRKGSDVLVQEPGFRKGRM